MVSPYDFVVIGAGPAGLTAVASLIDHGHCNIAWVDPSFSAGRIGEHYREVPSNTQVRIFLSYVSLSPTLREMVDLSQEKTNAYKVLQAFRHDRGVDLQHAAELLIFLSHQLIQRRSDQITTFRGKVQRLELLEQSRWSVGINLNLEGAQHQSNSAISIQAPKIVLATGSEPREINTRGKLDNIAKIDLDTALSPTSLGKALQEIQFSNDKIAVVGSSHSAMLVLKNLTDLSPPSLEIIHLYRSPLKFAQYMDGWILYDNTGLKGLVADWAREVYPNQTRIAKVQLTGDLEQQGDLYYEHLKQCSRTIFAVGYCPVKLPVILVDGKEKVIKFDHQTGRFDAPGLYACGIAFPERVIDPVGNVEYAVGFFKFMKFLNRVCKVWIEE